MFVNWLRYICDVLCEVLNRETSDNKLCMANALWGMVFRILRIMGHDMNWRDQGTWCQSPFTSNPIGLQGIVYSICKETLRLWGSPHPNFGSKIVQTLQTISSLSAIHYAKQYRIATIFYSHLADLLSNKHSSYYSHLLRISWMHCTLLFSLLRCTIFTMWGSHTIV